VSNSELKDRRNKIESLCREKGKEGNKLRDGISTRILGLRREENIKSRFGFGFMVFDSTPYMYVHPPCVF